MRATRAPSSSSLLHIIHRHHQSTLRASVHTHTQCLWRVQSAGSPSAIALTQGARIGCRGFATSSPRHTSNGLPPPGNEPYLNLLLPKDKSSGRKFTQSEPTKGRRGFFGLRSRSPPPPESSSPRYLDGNNGVGGSESILGRHLGQKSNDLVLRCTEFDQDGELNILIGRLSLY